MRIWYNIERTFKIWDESYAYDNEKNVRALLIKNMTMWIWQRWNTMSVKVVILYSVMLKWHKMVWTVLDSAGLWIGLLGKMIPYENSCVDKIIWVTNIGVNSMNE